MCTHSKGKRERWGVWKAAAVSPVCLSFPLSSPRPYLSISRLLFPSPILSRRPPLVVYLPLSRNRENSSKLLTPVEVICSCSQLDYDSAKVAFQVSLIWAHPMGCGCRGVGGGSCTPHHQSRHRQRNRHLSTSSSASPTICPWRFLRSQCTPFPTSPTSCFTWWIGKEVYSLYSVEPLWSPLFTLMIWKASDHPYNLVELGKVQDLSCTLHGWNSQPESSKMSSRGIAGITVSWELVLWHNCCQLFTHIAIHIVRELVWTLTFTSLKAFGLNGYFISPSKRQAEAWLLSPALFSESCSRNYESSLSFLLNKAVAISFIEWGSE